MENSKAWIHAGLCPPFFQSVGFQTNRDEANQTRYRLPSTTCKFAEILIHIQYYVLASLSSDSVCKGYKHLLSHQRHLAKRALDQHKQSFGIVYPAGFYCHSWDAQGAVGGSQALAR